MAACSLLVDGTAIPSEVHSVKGSSQPNHSSKWNVLNVGLVLQTWHKLREAQLKLALLVLVLPNERKCQTRDTNWKLTI